MTRKREAADHDRRASTCSPEMERRVLHALADATIDDPIVLLGSLAIAASALAERGQVIGVRCPNRGPLRWYLAGSRSTRPLAVAP